MIGLRGIFLSVTGHLLIAGWLMSAATSAPSPAEDMSAADEMPVTLTLAREEAAVAPEDAPPPATEQQVEMPPVEKIPEMVASLPDVVPPVAVPEPDPPQPVPEVPRPEISQPVPSTEPMPIAKREPAPEPEKISSIEPSQIPEFEKPKPAEIVKKLKPKQVQKKIDDPARKLAGDGKGSSKPKLASVGSSAGKQQASGGSATSRTYAALVLSKLRNARQNPQDGATGRVSLSFTVSASGGLLSVNASGADGSLKSAALGMVRSAAPFPAMPDGMNRPHMSFTVPVQFN